MVITSSCTLPLEWQCPQPNSLSLIHEGRLTTSWELQNSTVEGLVSLFAKSFIFQYPHPLPCSVCVKEGSSQWWPPLLLIHVPRYQGSAALRCWELKCEELSRWRHYAMAIVTPLVDNFYFATTAFIVQVFYLKCSRFVLLRISMSGIGNSVRVWCIVESLCHRIGALQLFIQATSFCWADSSIHLCLVLRRQSSEAHGVSGRNSLVSLLIHDVLF